jgi:hypothetical protein
MRCVACAKSGNLIGFHQQLIELPFKASVGEILGGGS